MLLCWSLVGFATGWVQAIASCSVCRVLLGFFEAGQWPCALVTSQRLLSRRDRPLGNSIIQSGASLGAIATPFVVLCLATAPRAAGDCLSASSAPPAWPGSLPGWPPSARATCISRRRPLPGLAADDDSRDEPSKGRIRPAICQHSTFIRRFLAVAIVVVVINLCWQFFRAWMPKMLREQYLYDAKSRFSSSRSAITSLPMSAASSIGFLTKFLASRGLSVHGARVTTFFVCSLLTVSERRGRGLAGVFAAARHARW